MNWVTFVVPVALIAALAVFRRTSQVSARHAAELLKAGALVIDVRTSGEFRGGHLCCAINIPHDQIESLIARHVPAKEHALLLHCQSGMRSALARRKLNEMGYPNAFDLGSYARAMRIIG